MFLLNTLASLQTISHHNSHTCGNCGVNRNERCQGIESWQTVDPSISSGRVGRDVQVIAIANAKRLVLGAVGALTFSGTLRNIEEARMWKTALDFLLTFFRKWRAVLEQRKRTEGNHLPLIFLRHN